MRAWLVVLVVVTGCASARTQVIGPFARPQHLCLKTLRGPTPEDVADDVVARVESALVEIGVDVVWEPPCDQTAEISLVGGRPWLLGWMVERLTLRVRDSSGRLLATIEQSAPTGANYVFYLMDPFLAAITKTFRGAR